MNTSEITRTIIPQLQPAKTRRPEGGYIWERMPQAHCRVCQAPIPYGRLYFRVSLDQDTADAEGYDLCDACAGKGAAK